MPYLALSFRFLFGALFVVSAASKLLGTGAFAAFVRSLRRMGLLPRPLVRAVAGLVVCAEVAVVLLLAAPVPTSGVAGFSLAAVLLTGFGAAIAVSVRRGQRTPCRCFGKSTVPLGTRHVVRNLLLVLAAVLGVAASLAGGAAQSGQLVVAAVAGLVTGVLVTLLDDLVLLFRPTPLASRSR